MTSVLIRDRGEGHVKMGAKTGVTQSQAKDHRDPLQTVTGEEGAQSCQGVRVSGFQSPARMNVCCSKPLALWGFVAVALGNVYTDFASS